jgi:lipoprotein signal peptidase
MTASSIIMSIFVSGAGFVLFSYGKKMQRLPQMVCGVVLLVFPYFVPDPWLMLGIALALGGALWLALARGL